MRNRRSFAFVSAIALLFSSGATAAQARSLDARASDYHTFSTADQGSGQQRRNQARRHRFIIPVLATLGLIAAVILIARNGNSESP